MCFRRHKGDWHGADENMPQAQGCRSENEDFFKVRLLISKYWGFLSDCGNRWSHIARWAVSMGL